ncbi:MAG: TIGR01777 family oxidoreductase [Planctomycetales bacterium]|nr:TIGR01777 family oxidoreductase [Planctomycetales bacterium]
MTSTLVFEKAKTLAGTTLAISGANGLVGRVLTQHANESGAAIRRLVRGLARTDDEIAWSAHSGVHTPSELEGLNAFVHLAGESIAGRWSAAKKARILNSRIEGTQRIVQALAGLEQKPAVLVCASAVGFYGDRSNDVVDEDSPAGKGFLSEVCQGWEDATRPAEAAGIRVVNLRLGVVLNRCAGALATMLPVFRLGMGGRIGDGRQWLSWVSSHDVAAAIEHAILDHRLQGPVNCVSPSPCTNAEFVQQLAKTLGRPACLPVPAFALKLAVGEMANETLLSSTRAVPKRLLDCGFEFQHGCLDEALQFELQQNCGQANAASLGQSGAHS